MQMWYCSRGGKTSGPHSIAQLQEKVRAGTLAPNDLVAIDGTSQWAAASTIPGLFAAPAVAVAAPGVPTAAPAKGRSPVAVKPAVPLRAKPIVPANTITAVRAAAAPAAVKPTPSSTVAALILLLPKPILFGLCGGLGGLLGAVLVGELVWAILSPARLRTQEPRVRLAVPDSVRIFPGARNFLVVRVGREAFTGPIAIEAVKPPIGVTIDAVQVAPDEEETAIIVAADAGLAAGKHTIRFRAAGPENSRAMADFASLELLVEPRPPSLRITAPPQVAVLQGGRTRFTVRIRRDKFDEPIVLRLLKLPDAGSATDVRVPADVDKAEVEVEMARNAAVAVQPIQVAALAERTGASLNATADLLLDVRPAVLRMAAPPKLSLFQGGKTRFTVQIRRTHVDQPVTVVADQLPAGVTAPAVRVPPGADQAQIEIASNRETTLGTKPIRVKALCALPGGALVETADLQLEILTNPAPKADIIFVLDLTGSMQFAINGIKNGIQNFAAQLQQKDLDARLGLVCFRDIEDDRELPFVLNINGEPLTRDFASYGKEVGKQVARGGGDEPESSLQALALAAKQPFRRDAVKILVLITDAPPKLHRAASLKPDMPRTLDETIGMLKKNEIDQVHLVVHQRHYDGQFKAFHKDFRGSFIGLSNNPAAAFGKILPQLGDAISKITVTATPPPPSAELPPAPADAPPPSSAEVPPPPPAFAGDTAPPTPPPPALKAVQSTEQYAASDRLRLLLALAAWTMVIASSIGLPILAGQAFYARQGWMSLPEGGRGLAVGLLAGLVAGAMGQLFFEATSGGTLFVGLSRVVSWSLLGALLAGGLSFGVPNLRWHRGIAGGAIGGFLGALAFVVVSLLLGSLLGRCIGAAILGFCIGLMIALVELVFRRWWLEVAFSPREVRTITLGAAPVTLGGNERGTSVFIPGAAALALRYSVQGNRVVCEDPVARTTTVIEPGAERSIGRVRVTLCSAAHARQIGYRLHLSTGPSIRLAQGLPLTVEDLPSLEPAGPDGVVALIATMPNDPTKLLLRNRSRQTWSIRSADGTMSTVEPTRSIAVADGLKIAFGSVTATLKRDTAA